MIEEDRPPIFYLENILLGPILVGDEAVPGPSDIFHVVNLLVRRCRDVNFFFPYGLYANAHRGKVKKTSLGPLACVQCGGTMKIIAFLTAYPVVDRIINHLQLTFVADKPPPPRIAYQELWMAVDVSAEYFS